MGDQLHDVSESRLAHVADLRERHAKLRLLWHGASKLKLVHELLLLLQVPI